MKPFERACYPDALTDPARLAADFGLSMDDARDQSGRMRRSQVWQNDEYEVAITQLEHDTVHLSIKRRDKAAERDWRKFQEIKNALVGRECEAVELYPAESRLVDSANQYHLWACTDPTFRFPIGFRTGHVTDTPGGNAKQRPRS